MDNRKMENTNEDFLNYSFWMFKLLGLHPKNKKITVVLLAIFYTVLYLLLYFFAILQFYNVQGDLIALINNLEAIAVFIQIHAKIVIPAFQQQKFVKLIDNTKLLWKTNKCTVEVQLGLETIFLRSLKLQKFFFRSVVVSISVMLLSPLFGIPLPLGIWSMEGHDSLYKCYLLLQETAMPLFGFFIVGLDCTFLAFCTELLVQFRILCHCLKKLNFPDADVSSQKERKENFNKIKLYIQHHIFLLRFLKTVQETYSPAILFEYLTIAPIICVEMYVLLEGNTTNQQVRAGMVSSCLVLQLAVYCIPADQIISEAVAVGDAMYNSDWYSTYDSTLRIPLLLIIQKSQQQVVFTAGGLVEINSRTLLTLLKVSWSACTIMRALKEE